MYLPPDARTHSALGGSPTYRTRVEIWFGGEQIDEVGSDRIEGGGVTATFATGPRRTLDMSVEPSADWLEWLRIGVEIRPFRAVVFGGDALDFEECPLGCFPVRKFTRPLVKSGALPVRAQDRWQWVLARKSERPRRALRGLVTRVVAQLVDEVNPYAIDVNLDGEPQTFVPAGIWTRPRGEVIGDLLTSIGYEAFFDRLGELVIRRRPGTRTPVHTLRPGRGGTVNQITGEIDWEKAYNSVTIIPTATDTTLHPRTYDITNPTDPAYRGNINGGTRSGGIQEFTHSSAVFTTGEEMDAAGWSLLRKVAAPARQYSAAVIPHPGLDEADTVYVEGVDGLELAQVQQITYPLTAGELQQITTVSTRTDEDETP